MAKKSSGSATDKKTSDKKSNEKNEDTSKNSKKGKAKAVADEDVEEESSSKQTKVRGHPHAPWACIAVLIHMLYRAVYREVKEL